jgi:hypothetical protein
MLKSVEKTSSDVEINCTAFSALLTQLEKENGDTLLRLKKEAVQCAKRKVCFQITTQIEEEVQKTIAHIRENNSKDEKQNDEMQEILKNLEIEKSALCQRIAHLTKAVEDLQSHILISVNQDPLISLNYSPLEIVVDIPPMARKTPLMIANLVLLTPGYAVARRLQATSDRVKFFGRRRS